MDDTAVRQHGAHPLHQAFEQLQLPQGLVAALGIGRGKMAEKADQLETGEGGQRCQHLLKLVGHHPQPPHTDVHLEVDPHPPTTCRGKIGQGHQGIAVVDHRGQLLLDHLGKAGRRRTKEDNHLAADPGLPQLHALLHLRHPEEPRPGLPEGLGGGQQPVAIGIGLDHTQDRHPVTHELGKLPVVMVQSGEVDLDPVQ